MRLEKDPQPDPAWLRLSAARVVENKELSGGIALDFAEAALVAGIKVLEASSHCRERF